MGNQGTRAAIVTALVVLSAMPFAAAATTYDAKLVVLSVDGLKDLPTNYEYKAVGDLKTYTITGRVASETGRVFLNVTSPANVRAGDDSRLTLEYPVSWTQKGFSNDTKPQNAVASASVSFALGRLPAEPPTGPVSVKASVDKTIVTLRILPPDPILVIDAPAEDGIVYVDATGDAPFQVRTLYYPDGDRLVGPGFLGGKSLGMPQTTDIKMNGKLLLKPSAETPCGLHPMSVASVKVKGTSTGTHTIYGGNAGPVDAVAVIRTPTVAFPGGFVTDVAPAEVTLRCFPPQSRVELRWAATPTGEMKTLATYTVADSGALDEFVGFPKLTDLTSVVVQARIVEGPQVLDLGKYTANVTVPVREVASSDELNLVVEAETDRPVYDLGDIAQVTGRVILAGKPASGVDVTVVWPFEDAASAREDGLQARTVKSDSTGAFSIQFSASPTGKDASFAPSSTEGDRVVLVTARKVGLNTGVARVPILATGLAPFTIKDVKWRPEVVQPGASATVTGTLVVPSSLAGLSGLLEGARVEVRTDPLAAVAVGRAATDGVFSVPVTIPEGTAAGVYPTSVVAWGRAPDALGGVLLAPGVTTALLKVGDVDAKPVGKDQRAAVKEIRSLGTGAAAAEVVHLGETAAAANGVVVAHGDRVVVAPGSELVLDLADQGATATLGNATRADLLVSRVFGGKNPTVFLLSTPGSIRFDSADAAPSSERSVVVLTRFHDLTLTDADAVVTATADGGVDVQVWQGKVTVANREGGPSTDVASGKRLAIAGDTSVASVTATSLSGASPFTAPEAPDDTPTPGTEPVVPKAEDSKTPAPWLAGIVLALLAALLVRRR